MNTYARKAYFEAHSKLDEAFETYDGVIHPTRAVANKWVERHANKTVIRLANPAKEPVKQTDVAEYENWKKENAGKIKFIVDEEYLAKNPALTGEGVKVGDTIVIPEPTAQPPVVKMKKLIVTEEDLLNNLDLVEQGVKVGDEIEIPEETGDGTLSE